MQDPLSEEEIAMLRALILADARRQWVVSGIKAVSLWIAALSGGYLAFRGAIADMLGWAGK